MFVSKYHKTYDTRDGSEQSFDGLPPGGAGAQRGGQIARERWEDDGGPANDQPAPALLRQPAWSVLPLRELNEAIRRAQRPDDPQRLRLEASRAERRASESRHLAADRATAAARAEAGRYRNAWENT